MRQRHLFVGLMSLAFFGCESMGSMAVAIQNHQTYGSSYNASAVRHYDCAPADEGLDLRVLVWFIQNGSAKDPASLERALNENRQGFNNLDLDCDEYTDYIRVREYADGISRLWSLEVTLDDGSVQEVASIGFELTEVGVTVEVIGNSYIYGPDVYFSPGTLSDLDLIRYLYSAEWKPYESRWGRQFYGSTYPDWYNRRYCLRPGIYQNTIYTWVFPITEHRRWESRRRRHFNSPYTGRRGGVRAPVYRAPVHTAPRPPREPDRAVPRQTPPESTPEHRAPRPDKERAVPRPNPPPPAPAPPVTPTPAPAPPPERVDPPRPTPRAIPRLQEPEPVPLPAPKREEVIERPKPQPPPVVVAPTPVPAPPEVRPEPRPAPRVIPRLREPEPSPPERREPVRRDPDNRPEVRRPRPKPAPTPTPKAPEVKKNDRAKPRNRKTEEQ